MILGVDFETASAADLKVRGAWRYSLDESTRVWCAVFGTEGNLRRWRRGDPPPKLPEGATWLAHNCAFEKAIWTNVLHPRYGWPPCPTEWEDTQAHAAASNLPTTLEGLGAAIGAPVQKDKEGHDLMLSMCWLEQDAFGEWSNPNDIPENQRRLLDYCERDVESMFSIWRRQPKMVPSEKLLWELDQRINARGVYIDRELVARMLSMAEQRRHQLQDDAWSVSEGDILDASKTPALKKWLTGHKDIALPKAKRTRVTGEQHLSESVDRAAAAEMMLDEGMPADVRAMLENRLEASKLSSLAKLKKVEKLIDPRDGRLRNSLQFCGAHTGRWSSRGLQLHNFARPKKGDTPAEKEALKRAYAAVLSGDYLELRAACETA